MLSPSLFLLCFLSFTCISALLILWCLHFSLLPAVLLQLYPFIPLSITPSSPPLSHHSIFIKHITRGCMETNVPLSFSPTLVWLIGIYSPYWSRVGGQNGIHYHVCECLHAHWRWIRVCICVSMCLRRRKKHLGCESWRVCHIACTYSTVYEAHRCICVSFHSLSTLVWMQWEGIGGERHGLGRRYKAYLMPVCINAVWHLSARDMHTLWRAEILWHYVCEQVCVEVMVPVAKLPADKLIFFFLFFCTLVPVDTRPISFTMVAKLRGIFISIFVSPHPPFLVLPFSHCHYSCNLCPCNNLDALPECSKQLTGSHSWIPYYARKFLEKGPSMSTYLICNEKDFWNGIQCIVDFFSSNINPY